MKFYFAPLEGITGYVFRNVYHELFGAGVDKYFTPFIAPTSNKIMKTKEFNDMLPEHNQGMVTVPQILCNDADLFINAAQELNRHGYTEVNLNLGCPSGTVVSKYRGSGFLAQPEKLDAFLDRVYEHFANTDMKVSLKTRIGKEDPEEFHELLRIFNQYPVSELIIHPRIRTDFYKNKPNLTVFQEAVDKSGNPLCYNGDIFTAMDYRDMTDRFPTVDSVMLGRGLIANPGLIRHIKDGSELTKEEIRTYNYRLLEAYQKALSGDKFVLFKTKEMWIYMGHMFTNHEKYVKKMKKSQTVTDFKIALEQLLHEQEIIQEAGFSGDKR